MQKRADNIALKKAKKVLDAVGVMTSQNHDLNIGAVSKPKVSAKKILLREPPANKSPRPPIVVDSESDTEEEIVIIKNKKSTNKKATKQSDLKTRSKKLNGIKASTRKKTIIFDSTDSSDSSDSSSDSDSDSSSGSSYVQSPKYTKRKNVKNVKIIREEPKLIKPVDYNIFFA